jgi:hypothetical protein
MAAIAILKPFLDVRQASAFAILWVFLFVGAAYAADDPLRCVEASKHIGKVKTVCGRLTQGQFRQDVRGQPTFLNCDGQYPNHVFTWLIWGEDRANYGNVERMQGSCVCGRGVIQEYRGKPEIIRPENIHPARDADEIAQCR